MKFNLSLKKTHIETINDLKTKHSVSSSQELIKKYVESSLELSDKDLIFGQEREKCSGGCFASEPQFSLELDDDIFNKLKKIFDDYKFDSYKTSEEEVSKIIRCIINFIEEEPDLITI